MSIPALSARGDMWMNYHMFFVAEINTLPHTPIFFSNGLVAAQPGIAIIATGIHTGKVAISVEVYTESPEVVPEGWDEVVEISLEAVLGSMSVCGLESQAPAHFPSLTPEGPGWYRIRVHARGRDTAVDLTASTPVEDYLIMVWPAPQAPEIVYRQTDAYGAQQRVAAERE